jgi:hypothetical protein
VTNPGGHSSRPVPDNAIYHLSAALTGIGAYDFPPQLQRRHARLFHRMAAGHARRAGRR